MKPQYIFKLSNEAKKNYLFFSIKKKLSSEAEAVCLVTLIQHLIWSALRRFPLCSILVCCCFVCFSRIIII